MSKLVIVESPAKAKTIQKYLGSGYEVIASMGHIRDLPKSTIGVDIEKDFEPKYIEMKDKKDVIKRLRDKASDSDYVYLATDPDREGEAISWHLCHILALNEKDNNRITFNEITKSGVEKGISNPRMIDMDLVDAQQARRVLDRIVGYKLSPFLWKKVKRGLSAGRVQSVAVRIVVDRENEIRDFVAEEYWSIDALLQKEKSKFEAHLHSGADGKKISIVSGEQAESILKALDGAEYVVKSVKKGTRKKQPAPPFTTSTMQQEASRKLNFNAQRTMKVAQELYEGVDVNGVGATGLITYMRTDSLRISEDARYAGNAYIKSTYGDKYLPEKPRYYKQKSGAQDGHEAIRPTNPSLTPESVKASLTTDQYKLYKLVWERFIASLMECCLQNTVNVDISAGEYTFKASGYSVKFEGYTVLYEEGKDEDEEAQKALPALSVGDVLTLKKLTPNQHFTQPPARYTEATLIKALEENGIGRPSTYAPTISTIISREYVERQKKLLVPTALGEIITGLMKDMFKDIVDLKFTAKIETQLDNVEEGKLQWVEVLKKFYGDFDKTLKSAEQKMDGTRVKVPEQESDVVCEKCGRTMVVRSGRFGKFLACPGYPQCKNTKPIVTETSGACPKCGGKILLRKSPKGNKYYACEKGKECGFMTWDEPTAKNCPDCGKTLFKRRGGITVCLNEGCGYQVVAEKKTKKTTKSKAKANSEE
ncbi:MAG: type I DNA topoisomerase [Clostridia bacterium]|nr:type I DNA topoisomerase [Clostridia bacterium]